MFTRDPYVRLYITTYYKICNNQDFANKTKCLVLAKIIINYFKNNHVIEVLIKFLHNANNNAVRVNKSLSLVSKIMYFVQISPKAHTHINATITHIIINHFIFKEELLFWHIVKNRSNSDTPTATQLTIVIQKTLLLSREYLINIKTIRKTNMQNSLMTFIFRILLLAILYLLLVNPDTRLMKKKYIYRKTF